MLTLTAGVFVLWLASLTFTITRFGQHVSVTMEQGFVGVYWGNDAETRNSGLDNHFSTPWSPGRGNGRSFPTGMTWAVYPHRNLFQPSEWADGWRYGNLRTSVLGLWAPSVGVDRYAAYIILPLWLPLLLLALSTAILGWRDRRHRPGHCQRCGYDLTGNVTGVCSECGHTVPLTRASGE
jgi:hypothetical protein